jgi:hypothetical protein
LLAGSSLPPEKLGNHESFSLACTAGAEVEASSGEGPRENQPPTEQPESEKARQETKRKYRAARRRILPAKENCMYNDISQKQN